MLPLLLLLWGMKEVEGRPGYSLDVKWKVVVQEGLCILVPCEFSYPAYPNGLWTDSDPVHGYWFQDGAITSQDSPVATNNPRRPAQARTRGRFFLLGEPLKNNCSLEIRETRKDDARSYFFRLERGAQKFNYFHYMMTLHVTDLTKTPDILIPGTLEAGCPSNLTCSAPWACGSPTFSWTGSSVSLLSTNTAVPSVLTFIPQPRDHGTNLTCQVTLPGAGVTTRKTIRLNVSYAPKNLTVTISQGADSEFITPENGSSLSVSEGQSLRLLCSTDSNPPANLSWTLDNLSLCPSKLPEPGSLELFLVHLKHEGVYTCQAQHALGSQYFSLSLHLQRKSGLMAEVVLVAVVEAAVKVLLLGLCLIILRVRSHRKKTARATVHRDYSDMTIS
ncbi:hypothetical protein U0070_023142 [Myodes glareolus]|uniref:Ig-like domain-containing protein n=1 Tax=Myodes glareolus TaxID=447135 RepID=A0AAW0HTY0_MYOGA